MKKIKIGDCFKGDYQPILVVDNDHPYADGCFLVSDLAERSAYLDTDELAKREPLPTLHLPIKGKWFDLILSGQKKEEYREVKPFCCSRLGWVWNDQHGQWAVFTPKRDFKVLHLSHGYGHDKPQLWAHIEEISIGKGKPEWGAPDEDVFIIRLGKVFHTKNLKK